MLVNIYIYTYGFGFKLEIENLISMEKRLDVMGLGFGFFSLCFEGLALLACRVWGWGVGDGNRV